MHQLREETGKQENDLSMILKSYDLQAGSYRESYYNGFSKDKYIDGKNRKVSMSVREYNELRCIEIAKYIKAYEPKSILEVGVGECTTLADLLKNLPNDIIAHGVDISFSRIAYGNLFLKEHGIKNGKLVVGNMFSLPYKDNSFDIVYTYHTIEPNTGKEYEAIEELYRVTKKYLVLIEPTFELGNEETKKNIREHRYAENISNTLNRLGYNVIKHELFPVGTYKNQSAITIIEKLAPSSNCLTISCPVCKSVLLEEEHLFCEECLAIYPIIKGIPCLTEDSAILGSKFNDPILKSQLWKHST